MVRSLIGYDFDGVIVSGLALDYDKWDINSIHESRDRLRPIFSPPGDYFILTARPLIDRENTLNFIEKYLRTKPLFVIHDRDIKEDCVSYKIRKLREKLADGVKMTAFIESNLSYCDRIGEAVPEIKVIHFSSFIIDRLRFLR